MKSGSLARQIVFGLFCLLALAGVALPLALIVRGPDDLLLTALKDDGFYFLALARNIARGGGVSFDGLGPTNGFHPLWAFLLVPIFLFEHASRYIPIRIAILMATLLHLGAAAAVYRAARLLTSRYAAGLTALCYLFNPLALYLVVSGMESALVALLVALLAGESIRIRRGEAPLVGPGRILGVGVLCGLCMLARTDTVLLVGLVLATALIAPAAAREPTALAYPRLSLGLRLRGSVFTGLVALLTISPWLIWNLVRFGTLVQVSARAHQLHAAHQHAGGEMAGLARFPEMAAGLLQRVWNSIAGRTGVPQVVLGLVLAAALAVVVWWLAAVLGSPDLRRGFLRRLLWMDAPLLYAVGFMGATFVILGHIRSWYVAGPIVVGLLLLALPADYASRPLPLPARGRLAAGLLFAALALGILPLTKVFTTEMVQNARRTPCWREAAEWVAANSAPGERVASFNSGTFGYLAPRTVVNLDCVINNRAIGYLKERRLVEFMRGDRIRYLIDGPRYLARYLPAYAEEGWQEILVPVDTLASKLTVLELRD